MALFSIEISRATSSKVETLKAMGKEDNRFGDTNSKMSSIRLSAYVSCYKNSLSNFNLNIPIQHDGRGVVSMANSAPNTNASQFFITYGKHSQLDNKYTIFAR